MVTMLFLIAVVVFIPVVAIWRYFDYQKARLEAASHDSGETAMTASELQSLITEAVADATTELSARVAALEQERRSLPESTLRKATDDE